MPETNECYCLCFVASLVDDTTADVWGEYTSHMQRHWTCPHCDVSLIVSVVERLQHEVECQSIDKPGECTDWSQHTRSVTSSTSVSEYLRKSGISKDYPEPF